MSYLSSTGTHEGLIVGGMFACGTLLGIVPALRARSERPEALRPALCWAPIIGISAYLGNILQVRSIQLAPNPGYPSAVIGTQIVVVTLLATLWMRRPLAVRELTGIALCMVGLAMVVV